MVFLERGHSRERIYVIKFGTKRERMERRGDMVNRIIECTTKREGGERRGGREVVEPVIESQQRGKEGG